jgi:stage V sporulation protein B
MPIGVGLSLFSREILELLFTEQAAEITLAAPLLSVLGMSVALSCLVTVGNAVLQAYGMPHVSTASMAVGAVLKIALAYFLIGDPRIGIMGAPISTLACDLAINLINFYYIVKKVPAEIDVGRSFLRPFCAAVISASVSRLIYGALEARGGTGSATVILAIVLCAVTYLVLCLVLKVIGIDEFGKLLSLRTEKIKN